MRISFLILAASAAVLTAGCGREEEPVANRFERQKTEIEEKARTLEAQVENEVGAVEARLAEEADALINSLRGDNSAEANMARDVEP